MALIKCSECGKEISSLAKNCPNCGCPISSVSTKKDSNTNVQKKKKSAKRSTKVVLVAIFVFVLLLSGGLYLTFSVFVPMTNYQRAIECKKAGDYQEAINLFKSLGNYENSESNLLDSKYELAKQTYDNGDYQSAMDMFQELDDYKESEVFYKESCNGTLTQYLQTNTLEENVDLGEDKMSVEVSYNPKKNTNRIILSKNSDDSYDSIDLESFSPVLIINLDCKKEKHDIDMSLMGNSGLKPLMWDGKGKINCRSFGEKKKISSFKTKSSMNVNASEGITTKTIKELFESLANVALIKADEMLNETDLNINMETFGYSDLYNE